MTMKNWKAILGVCAVFVAGVLIGAVITAKVVDRRVRTLVARGPEGMVEVVVRRLSWELKLDASQRENLKGIARTAAQDLRALRRENQPRLDAIIERAATGTRALLHPDQAEKFEQIVARHRGRMAAEK
jgi:hypothetical protein